MLQRYVDVTTGGCSGPSPVPGTTRNLKAYKQALIAGWHRGRRNVPRGSAWSHGRGRAGAARGEATAGGHPARGGTPGPTGHTRPHAAVPGSGAQVPAQGARPGNRPPPAPAPPPPSFPPSRRGARRGDVAVCQQPAAGGLPPVQGNGQTRGSRSPGAGVERGVGGGQRPLLRLVLSVVRVPAPVCSALPAAPAGPAIPPPLEGLPRSRLCPRGRRAPAGWVFCTWPGSCCGQASMRIGTGCLRSGRSRWKQS